MKTAPFRRHPKHEGRTYRRSGLGEREVRNIALSAAPERVAAVRLRNTSCEPERDSYRMVLIAMAGILASLLLLTPRKSSRRR